MSKLDELVEYRKRLDNITPTATRPTSRTTTVPAGEPMAVDTRGTDIIPDGYRRADRFEMALHNVGDIGRTIASAPGYDFEKDFLNGKFEPDKIVPFLLSIPAGMAGGLLGAPEKLGEAFTGNRYSEIVPTSYETGLVSTDKLKLGQQITTGLDAAIDVFGLPFGATGKAIKVGAKALGLSKLLPKKLFGETAEEFADAALGPLEKKFGKGVLPALGDVALGAGEEGVEEGLQSIFGGIREGSIQEFSDIDWGDVGKAAAFGATAGGVLHGAARGVTALAGAIDAKASKAFTPPTNDTDPDFDWDTDATDQILPPWESEYEKKLNEVSQYAGSVYGRGVLSTNTKIEEIAIGGKSFTRMVMREATLDQSAQKLIPKVDQWIAANNNSILATRFNGLTNILDIVQRVERSTDPGMWDTFAQGLNEMLAAQPDGGLAAVIFKNPGGPLGAVRVKITKVEGQPNIIKLHGLISMLLASDYDSDMYSVILEDAWLGNRNNNRNTSSMQWANRLLDMTSAGSWTKNMLYSAGFNSDDVDGIIQAAKDAWSEINHASINNDLEIDSKTTWDSLVETIIRNESDPAFLGIDADSVKNRILPDNATAATKNKVGTIYTQVHTLPQLVQVIYRYANTQSDAGEIIGKILVSGATQQSSLQRTMRQAIQSNEQSSNNVQNRVKEQVESANYQARGKLENIRSNLDIIARKYQNIIFDPGNPYCRENLSLYYSVEDLITEVDFIVSHGGDVDFQTTIQKLMLSTMRLDGMGLHPTNVSIVLLRAAVAGAIQHGMREAGITTINTKGNYESFKQVFVDTYNKYRDWFIKEYKEANDGSQYGVELIVPDIRTSEQSANTQMYMFFENTNLKFFCNPKNQTIPTMNLGQLAATVVRQAALDIEDGDKKLEKHIIDVLSRNGYDASSADIDVIANFVKGYASRKSSESKKFSDFCQTLLSKERSGSLSSILKNLRDTALHGGQIKFDGAEGLMNVGSLKNYFSALYLIAGRNRFYKLGWKSVGTILSQNQVTTNWDTDTNTRKSIAAKIRNKFITDSYEDVIGGLVSLAAYDNTGKLRDVLYSLKRAVQSGDDAAINTAVEKLRQEAYSLSDISPLYYALVQNSLFGSDLLLNNNGNIIPDSREGRIKLIDKALNIIENFIDPDIPIQAKMQTTTWLNLHYDTSLGFNDRSFDVFFSDAMASTQDQEDITTLSSNMRAAEPYVDQLNTTSYEYCQDVIRKFDSATASLDSTKYSRFFNILESRARNFVETVNWGLYAAPIADIHNQPTEDAVKKTKSRPAFAAGWIAQTIRKVGRIVSDVQNVWDDRLGSLDWNDIENTPSLMSRIILTDYIDERGGLEIVFNGKAYRFTSRASLLEHLSGTTVTTNKAGKPVWNREIVRGIFENYPVLVNAIAPVYNTFQATGNGTTTVSASTTVQNIEMISANKVLEEYDEVEANDEYLKSTFANNLLSTQRGVGLVLMVMQRSHEELMFNSVTEAERAFRGAINEIWASLKWTYQESHHNTSEIQSRLFSGGDDSATNELVRAVFNSVLENSQALTYEMKAALRDGGDAIADVLDSVEDASITVGATVKILRDHIKELKKKAKDGGNIYKKEIERYLKAWAKAASISGLEEAKLLVRLVGFSRTGIEGTDSHDVMADALIEKYVSNIIDENNLAKKEADTLRDAANSIFHEVSGKKVLKTGIFFEGSWSSLEDAINSFDKLLKDNGCQSVLMGNTRRMSLLNFKNQAHNLAIGNLDKFDEFIDNARDWRNDKADSTQFKKQFNALIDQYNKLKKDGDTEAQLEKARQIFAVVAYDTIQDITSISRNDVNFGSLAYFQHDIVGIFEDGFRFIDEAESNGIFTKPQEERPNKNIFTNPISAVGIEAISRFEDELNRGNVGTGVSYIASTRRTAGAVFVDYPEQINARPADWQRVQARSVDDVVKSFELFATDSNNNGKRFGGVDALLKAGNIATGIMYENGHKVRVTPTMLKKWIDMDEAQRQQQQVVFCGAWEASAGFDSRFFGVNLTGAEHYNPYQQVLNKLNLNGAEAKQLKTAKKLGMFLEMNFSNVDKAWVKKFRKALVIPANATIDDIVGAVEKAKDMYIDQLYKIYVEVGQQLKIADGELDFSIMDFKMIADHAFQFVSIELDARTNDEIARVPVPYFQILEMSQRSQQQSDVPIDSLLYAGTTNAYEVTMPDGSSVRINQLLANKTIKEIDIIPSTATTLNQNILRRSIKFIEHRNNRKISECLSNDGDWKDGFIDGVQNGIQNGKYLYDYCFFNKAALTRSMQDGIARLSFNQGADTDIMPVQIRNSSSYNPEGNNVNNNINFETATKELEQRRSAVGQLWSQYKVVLSFGFNHGDNLNSFGFNSDSNNLRSNSLYKSDDIIVVGANITKDNGNDLFDFLKAVSGRQRGNLQQIAIDSTNFEIQQELKDRGFIEKRSSGDLEERSTGKRYVVYHTIPAGRLRPKRSQADIVDNPPTQAMICAFVRGLGGDGIGWINDVNSPGLATLGIRREEEIDAPYNAFDSVADVVTDPRQAVSEIARNEGLLDVSSFPKTEQADIRQAYEIYANAVPTATFSNGLMTSFPSASSQLHCIGLFETRSEINPGQKKYIPIIVSTNMNSVMGTPSINPESGNIIVPWSWRWDSKSLTQNGGSIKLFFPLSGLKGMMLVLDTGVHGQFNAGGNTNLIMWNDEFNGEKYDLYVVAKNNYYQWMRIYSATEGNSMLSLFLSDAGNGDTTVRDDIYSGKWTSQEKEILMFSSPNSPDFARLLDQVKSGEKKFKYPGQGNEVLDYDFNRAMKQLMINYKSSGHKHSLAQIMSGKKISKDQDSGIWRYHSQADSFPEVSEMFAEINHRELNILFSAISQTEYPNRKDSTSTFNWEGDMHVTSTNGFDDWVPVVIEAKTISNGVNVDADVSTLPSHVSQKILYSTALSQGTFNGTDYGALRAESILSLDDNTVRDYGVDENIQRIKPASDVQAIKDSRKAPASFYSNYIKRNFSNDSLESRNRAAANSYMNRGRFLSLLAERDYRPMIKKDDELFGSVKDMLSDDRLSAALNTWANHFDLSITEIPEDVIYDMITSQLAYTFNSGKGNSELYYDDVIKAINTSIQSMDKKGMIVSSDSISKTTGRIRFACPIIKETTIDFYHDHYVGNNKLSKDEYHENIVSETNKSLNDSKQSFDPAANRALVNMVEAYKSQSEALSGIDSGVIVGDINISDIAAAGSAVSKYVVGEDFANWAMFDEEVERRIDQLAKRRAKYNMRKRTRPPKGKWQLGVKPRYREDFIDSFRGDVLTGLANLSKVNSMLLPMIPIANQMEKFFFGGQGCLTLFLGRHGIGHMRTNLDKYFSDEELAGIYSAVSNAAKDKNVQMLIENKRLLSVLADQGYTNDMIQAAGGLKKFLEAHKAESSWWVQKYEWFMSIATGKGWAAGLQTKNYLFDLLRLISNDEVRAMAMFDKDPATGQARIYTFLDDSHISDFINENCFNMEGALWDLSEQAFNFSMVGDTAQKTCTNMWFNAVCANHPVFAFFSTTMMCRFPQFALNVAERYLNTVAPISSINYVIAKLASRKDANGNAVGLGKLPVIGTRGGKLSDLNLEDSLIVNSLAEAIGRDLAILGTTGVATLILGLGFLEPPDDEDKWGNIDEWLICGERIGVQWWLKDLLGLSLGIAATWKAASLGKPRMDIITSCLGNVLYNNPLIQMGQIVDWFFDPYANYMDSYYEEIDRFSSAADGAPEPTKAWVADAAVWSWTWLAQFITPSFLRELSKSSTPREVSYKKVAKVDEYGNVVKDKNGDVVYVNADYMDQKLRLMTRNNPMLGFIADIITGSGFAGDKTGYLRSEMPYTVYYDPTQMESYQALSLYTVDAYGNIVEKSEQEKQAIALAVITKLQQYQGNLEELYQEGFCLPYSTMKYVGDVVWDIAWDKQRIYQDMKSSGQLDYYVLGEGDWAEGKRIADEIYQQLQDDIQYWKDFYYNVLWSDPMKRGLQKYNRENTTYAKDDNGEWYATGYKQGGLLSMFFPVRVADKEGTAGYEGDWGTISAATGENTWERAWIPVNDGDVEIPKWESLSDLSNGGYSSSYGKYSPTYSSGGSGYSGGGSGRSYGYSRSSSYTPNPPRIYAPSTPSSRLQGPDTTYRSNRPVSNVDLNNYFIRPGFETKGSRKAYKREDI